MDPFEFRSVGRIVFGRGELARLGELAGEYGRAAMIITNAGEAGDGGVVDRATDLLAAAGLRHAIFRQRGEPRIEDVERATSIARDADCDVVVGLGGGSAVDAAKAVAGLLTNGGSPLDYMEVIGQGRKITRPAAPLIAVPTTAGTGAEVTRNAVLSCPQKQFKASLRSDHLLAKVALVDGELGVGVRAEVTARAGMDALCQLIESYTSRRAQPMTDALAIRGVELAAVALPKAVADGSDVFAREDMAMAALLSGITLTNAGLGAVHGFAAPLGANFPVPHGTACAALLGGVMSANVSALRAESAEHPWLRRYADVGRTLTGRTGLADGEAVDAGVAFVRDLAAELGIAKLSQFGVGAGDVERIVALARKSSSMRYNPVELSEETLCQVLAAAI